MGKTSGEQDVLRLALPMRQRKQPRQARSIALVDALIKAGNAILETEGRAALSLQKVSDYAGVAVSSIYEYFPTLDTLITAIFEDYRLKAQQNIIHEILALPDSARLFDALLLMSRVFLEIRQRELAIDQKFAEQNLQYSELLRLDIVRGKQGPPATATRTLLRRFANEIVSNDEERTVFIIYHTIQALPRVMALERPQYLGMPDTPVLLARMLHAVLTCLPAGQL